MTLADLLLLFIYTEVLGMIGVFYASNRIPITLPLFIAMTAISRLQLYCKGKGMDASVLLYEAGAILIIAIACLVVRYRPKINYEYQGEPVIEKTINIMDTYVLVHGAWHDGNLLKDVASAIETDGHAVFLPTLKGNQDGDSKEVGLDDAIDSLISYIKSNNVRNCTYWWVILMPGWSLLEHSTD